MKEKLQDLPKKSKKWWQINRELLNRKCKTSSIPNLKSGSNWITEAKEKAELFAQTFLSKAKLPAEANGTPFFGKPDVEFDKIITFRSRVCKRLFKKLDEKKATGHDKISAIILKTLAEELAAPFARVCKRLFQEGCWPTTWKS